MTFIENCRSKWWRFWSLRWAWIKTTGIGLLFLIPDTAKEVVNSLPPEWRGMFPFAVVASLAAADFLFRMIHQPKVAANAPAN